MSGNSRTPTHLSAATVRGRTVSSYKFFGMCLSENLSCMTNTTAAVNLLLLLFSLFNNLSHFHLSFGKSAFHDNQHSDGKAICTFSQVFEGNFPFFVLSASARRQPTCSCGRCQAAASTSSLQSAPALLKNGQISMSHLYGVCACNKGPYLGALFACLCLN